MFGFQLTKWFWTLWDNLLTIVLLNLASLATLGAALYLLIDLLVHLTPSLFATSLILVSSFSMLFLYTLFLHLCALINYSIVKNQSKDWKACLRKTLSKRSLFAVLLADLLWVSLLGLYYISWNFYSQQSNILSLLALGIMFWLGIFFLLANGFYLPLLVREQFAFKEAFKRSILICLDNLLLALLLALACLLLTAVSVIPPFMILFGAVGQSLWYEVSIRILYYKYQYIQQLSQETQERLEGQNNHKKLAIPWRALLREEREQIGPRSLRNLIFPWKD